MDNIKLMFASHCRLQQQEQLLHIIIQYGYNLVKPLYASKVAIIC